MILHNQIQILLADFGEVIGSLIGLVMLVLWVIGQIMEAKKQPAAPRDKAPAPAQPRAEAPALPAGQQADPLRNQVDEFLRRAGRKPQAAAARGQVAENEVEVLLPADEPRRERPPLAQPLRSIEDRPAVSSPQSPVGEPVVPTPSRFRPARRPSKSRRESVADHVSEHVRAHTLTLGEQASRLGQRIIQEDAQFDVQLKAKFDHSVGTLAESRDSVPAEAAPAAISTPAAQIAAMLSNPDGVRQAIVINEVLRRPTERW